MKTKIVILILVLAIAAGTIYSRSKYERNSAFVQRQQEAAAVLRIEKEELQKELDYINDQLRNRTIGSGNVVMLFEKPHESILSEVLPLMEDYGYPGTIAISADAYPGGEGCMTVLELRSLMDKGWDLCVYWDGEGSIGEYKASLEPIWAALGTDCPGLLYLRSGGYFTYKDQEILDAGFHVAVHHGEVTELSAREDKDDLFTIGASLWNEPGMIRYLQDLAAVGGSIVLTVDFESPYGKFNGDNFANMHSYLVKQEGNLIVTDLPSARNQLSEADRSSYLHQRKAWLEGEIARYDSQIDALFQLKPGDVS